MSQQCQYITCFRDAGPMNNKYCLLSCSSNPQNRVGIDLDKNALNVNVHSQQMLEFFRVSLSATLCHRRNESLTRSDEQKHQNMKLSHCQITKKVKEKVTNDQEVYRIKDVQNDKRIKANQLGCKQQFDEVHRTTLQQQSPQEKLLQLPDKSTTCFVRMASFGTQTTEEWKFKMSAAIASKATQTPLLIIDKEAINGKSEVEEHLKLQAWKDAKFFVTNQLMAQCLHTPNYTKLWRSTANYSSTKS